MTAICGFRDHSDAVWIGGDSRGINGSFIVPFDCPKHFHAKPWVIASAGNAAAHGPLVNECERLGNCETVADLAIEMRKILHEAGFNDTKEPNTPGPPDYGQETLVASPDGIWIIEGDGTVVYPNQAFLAIGRAQDICYGAAWAILEDDPELSGAALMNRVLQIAAKFYTSVAPPFWIKKVT